MSLPQAPMPPPLDMNQGMFEGIVEGPYPDDDYSPRGNKDMFDVYDDFDQAPKKNKKKVPVDIQYEGFMLEKAQPKPGEKPSWARVGRRPLPFDDKAMVDMVKKHRRQKGGTIDDDFKQLTSNQQGVVNRLLEERRRKEKTKNADWILYDVQRFGKWKWRTVDVRQMQVIIKRVDKNIPLKNGEYVKNAVKNQYHDFEIIDLAEPTNNGKKKDKKMKKSRSLDDLFDPVDDPLGLNMNMGMPPPPRDHGRNNNNHNQFDNHMPRDNRPQFDQMPPPPPLHPPTGAFPGDHNGPGQFPPPPFPPQQFQQPYPTSARQSFTNVNPFLPDPEVASPVQFDLPPMNDQQWPHPHPNGMERTRTRSRSRERRLSTRRPSIGVDTSMIRRLESKIDDLSIAVDGRKHMGSESSEYEDESMWSNPSDGRSWTPPSSPQSFFSDHKARGSLDRRRSSSSRDPRYHARYRSHRYQDAEVEPAYSYRSDRKHYSPEYRRGSKRPSIVHSQTYDDYPVGRAAEPRYPPAAPQPPRITRRLTEYSDRDQYENRDRDYDDRRQGDFRDLRDSRDVQDSRRYGNGYDGGRRESAYDGRRRSYVGGGGGGGGAYYP
jgi:hypothetical protein